MVVGAKVGLLVVEAKVVSGCGVRSVGKECGKGVHAGCLLVGAGAGHLFASVTAAIGPSVGPGAIRHSDGRRGGNLWDKGGEHGIGGEDWWMLPGGQMRVSAAEALS